MKRNSVWRVYAKKADFNNIAARFNVDPVVARVIRNRDVIGDDDIEMFLYGGFRNLHDPHLMKDMDKGTRIIADKITEGKRIRIISDYDVDGVMSNYVLLKGLRELGADVDYEIPHRIRDGYGINERIIRCAIDDKIDTIITCDNGISANAVISFAKDNGITVVVTDHHEEPADNLAVADAVIDIKQRDCSYPYKEICGAVVAFKFLQCLYERMGKAFNADEYKEFIALATVCDVMELKDENRIIVAEGLRKLKRTENLGLKALIKANALDDGRDFNSFHFGFVLGPCINAAGRLDDARKGLDLLLSETEEIAEERAAELVSLNETRKSMTTEGVDAAELTILEEGLKDDKVLVVYVPDLHESLAGIVAGRLRETYYKPVVVFTDSIKDKDILKGSGRSIEGYHMFKELEAAKDYLYKFGGHELAAGLSIKREMLAEVRRVLNENETMTEDILTEKIMIDVPMPTSYITIRLVEQLNALAPFGKGNEQPIFAESGFKVKRARILGKDANVLKLTLINSSNRQVDAIYFNPDEFINDINLWFTEEECDKMLKGVDNNIRLSIAYQPDINEYMGNKSIQIKIKHYMKTED